MQLGVELNIMLHFSVIIVFTVICWNVPLLGLHIFHNVNEKLEAVLTGMLKELHHW